MFWLPLALSSGTRSTPWNGTRAHAETSPRLHSPPLPSACLFEVEIAEPFRGHGLGQAMIRQLQDLTPAIGISTLTLQVSGDNLPALRLYKKTGFHITETLSYYLY